MKGQVDSAAAPGGDPPGEEQAALPIAARERTVLLVEDDDAMRTLMARALRRDGHVVVEAADGDAALDWLGLCLFDGSLERVPALIVSDIRLPHFDGLELLEGLLAAAPKIPVILITGFPSHETSLEAFDLGAERLLEKPFDLDELREAVSSALGAWPASTRSRPRDDFWTNSRP